MPMRRIKDEPYRNQDLDERGLRGMIISRRPNRRESSEKAPGPSSMMAADIIITKKSDSLVSNEFKGSAGTHESPTLLSPTSRLAALDRNPANSKAPLVTASNPTIHIPSIAGLGLARYIPPWTMAVTPTAARNSSSPAPGLPPGNV